MKFFAGFFVAALAVLLTSLPSLAGEESEKASGALEEANRALEEAARKIDDANRELEAMADVEPEKVLSACAQVFALPQHIAACQQTIQSRIDEKEPNLTEDQMRDRWLEIMQMADAAPNPDAMKALPIEQRTMWMVILEENAAFPQKMCDSYPRPGEGVKGEDVLSPESLEQSTGVSFDKISFGSTCPTANDLWERMEAEKRTRLEAQKQKMLNPNSSP